jgi:hypothetical protein
MISANPIQRPGINEKHPAFFDGYPVCCNNKLQ